MKDQTIVTLERVLPEHVDDAVQLLDSSGVEKLAFYASNVDGLLRDGRAVAASPLQGDADEVKASELLLQGEAAMRELDLLRRRHVDPLNVQVATINKLFHVVTDPIEALCGKQGPLERVILAYRSAKRSRIAREQEEARRKAEAAAQAEAEALARAEQAKTPKAREAARAEAAVASQAIQAAEIEAPRNMTRGYKTDSGATSASERYVLLGFTDMDLVPPSYWRHEKVIDALKSVIQAAIKSGVREVPGCAIGIEEGLTRRPGA